MITGELKSKVDRVWEAFWTGGIANPLTVIEQITYLLFIRRLDELHTAKEKRASLLNQPIKDAIFAEDQQQLRWSHFKDIDAEEMYKVVSQKVFPFMKEFGGQDSVFSQQMKGATFMIPTPNLLERVVSMLSAIDMNDRDTKGDLYEYLLSKVATAGTNGQFRTPRHIIRMMVDMMEPTPTDTICDPSAGTCGFLVSAGEYMREKHPEMLLRSDLIDHFQNHMFNGLEFDSTMIRIGAMNLLLHGIENPQLHYRDALSEANTINEAYTLILANPPFKGSLDHDSVEKSLLKTVSTKKTELLFLALMLRMLRAGGRAAVIVPDGVLFGSSKAHKAIRQELIDNQKLEAVISMPSGVFKPYAGVSTAVLIFTKTNSGGTDKVWFYDMQADGFSLDDKRNPLDVSKHENNNIPDILTRWQQREAEHNRARTEQSFMVPLADIQANAYDLSINRYKEAVYQEVKYDSPQVILAAIRQLDEERQHELKELEELLG
ncbi:N-6 DNA methylase [Pontibacter locisalis]|uniref:site-specific DNA-methyltransferase (adenine-specific) n=1 Tax=Pontibacter locisalis TaxID=1719035 RepID=A0ABW5IKL1_9BACT